MVRTTVVGSYPRIDDTHAGQRLRRMIRKRDRGKARPEEVQAVTQDVVREVLHEQARLGVDLVTDGLVSWEDPPSHLARGLEGFVVDGLLRYFDTNTYFRQPVAEGPVAWSRPVTLDDFAYAAQVSPKPVKAVLLGPYTLATLSVNRAFPTEDAFVLALADALAEEVQTLVAAGAHHVQVDEPWLTQVDAVPEVVSQAWDVLAKAADGAVLSLFAYFGSVARVFADVLDLPWDVLGLDLVQGRTSKAMLREHPLDRPVVLGLVDARNTREENPASVAAEALELADVVPLATSYLSPSNGLEFLPREKARRKLAILARAARRVEAA